MSKPTLLDMTQEILSAMSSDEVNSISDSAESLQVATILKRKFFDIVSRSSLTEYKDLFKLNPSLDITKPTLMSIPEEISSIEWMKYYNSDDSSGEEVGFEYVDIIPVTQFIDMVTRFNPAETNVSSFTFTTTINGVSNDYTFYYKNDAQPTQCCVIGDEWVVFDSFDATLDSTLQQSKTMGYGLYSPVWEMTDDFIPELDTEQFSLLINEAKTLAFYELKQQPHELAALESRRQWTAVQKNKSKSPSPTYFDNLPDFARRGSRNSRNWPFK